MSAPVSQCRAGSESPLCVFNGKNYLHPMIAEQQRKVAVSLKALHLMQEHHGNRFFSFKCVSHAEEAEWYAKAEKLVPQCETEGS